MTALYLSDVRPILEEQAHVKIFFLLQDAGTEELLLMKLVTSHLCAGQANRKKITIFGWEGAFFNISFSSRRVLYMIVRV